MANPSSSAVKRIPELNEAFEVAKRDRVLSIEEEKKLRRSVSNQISAKRVRLRRSQYIEEMEKKIAQFEETVANLSPEVQNLKQANAKMEAENSTLEDKLNKWTDYNNSVDAEIEGKRAEIKKMKECVERMLRMKNGGEGDVANSTEIRPVSESYFRPPEIYSRVRQSSELEPEPEVEDIEQYLNLEALHLSNSTKNLDI